MTTPLAKAAAAIKAILADQNEKAKGYELAFGITCVPCDALAEAISESNPARCAKEIA